ncbi:unnamed protein product [Candidula unifasciata]|uniref:Uncharacterized protein n=1 Tax=Candidula unifasciata TaxID=100452 RepID=A0A8S3YRT6_9EUPU|nr:unnamed protein product [Candidula unifasciata]
MSSTASRMDKDDHPRVYIAVNTILWLCMLVFVAIPFGLVSALLLVVVRPISIIYPDNEVIETSDFLELCQFMPEICIAHILAGNDFVQCIESRTILNPGTPV